MTFAELYEYGKQRLLDAKVPDFDVDAWLLLEFATGITRATYYADRGKEVDEDGARYYHKLLAKRAERVPLQHLTNSQEFMGLDFYVNGDVLIPRQDTEILVETALGLLKLLAKEKKELSCLDMCTGSGCIPVSLAHYAVLSRCDGADISQKALKVAEKNAARYGGKVHLVLSDLFENIEKKYDLITSNPPYIKSGEIEDLEEEVRIYDPRIALDGMEDGLYFYRKIVREAGNHLHTGGYLVFEIGCHQAEDVARMMRESGFEDVCVKKDLAGLDRVLYGMYNNQEK